MGCAEGLIDERVSGKRLCDSGWVVRVNAVQWLDWICAGIAKWSHRQNNAERTELFWNADSLLGVRPCVEATCLAGLRCEAYFGTVDRYAYAN